MQNFEDILKNETILHEYKMALLLNMFKKICFKMNKEDYYKKWIKKLFMESNDSERTSKNTCRMSNGGFKACLTMN